MPEGRSDTMPEGIPRSETPRNGDPGVSDSTEDGRIVLPRGTSAYFLITNRIDLIDDRTQILAKTLKYLDLQKSFQFRHDS